MKFHRVAEEEWEFVDGYRSCDKRRLLNGPPYEEIVAALCRRLELESVRWQKLKAGEDAHRVVIKLRSTVDAVTFFHNSSSGYRAQYWRSIASGEAANRLALDTLFPHVVPLVQSHGMKQARLPTLDQSLHHPAAKIWIHQGSWLRYARREDRVLRVQSWQSQLNSEDKRRRKLARWACLAPQHESSIILKGWFMLPNGLPWTGSPHKQRSEEIHLCGFT